MDAYIELDFEKQKINGFTILTMVSQIDFLYDIILDLKGIDIIEVTNLNDADLTFTVSQTNPNIGDSLHILLTSPLNKGKVIDLIVYFQTNDKQTAASWISAKNTPGGNIDMMFT